MKKRARNYWVDWRRWLATTKATVEPPFVKKKPLFAPFLIKATVLYCTVVQRGISRLAPCTNKSYAAQLAQYWRSLSYPCFTLLTGRSENGPWERIWVEIIGSSSEICQFHISAYTRRVCYKVCTQYNVKLNTSLFFFPAISFATYKKPDVIKNAPFWKLAKKLVLFLSRNIGCKPYS